VKLIGNVLLEIDKKKGLIIQWRGEDKPKVKRGDNFLIKYRDSEVMKIIVGMTENISEPAEYYWLAGKILPSEGERLKCDVYSYEI